MAERDIQSGGILLAENWKLVPVDQRNWELCNRHECADSAASRKSGNAGRVMWFRCGRFYSYNTVEEALLHVIDELWKSGCADGARELSAGLAGYRACVAEVRETLAGALSELMGAAGDRG